MKGMTAHSIKILLQSAKGACIAIEKDSVAAQLRSDLEAYVASAGIRCESLQVVPSASTPGYSCLYVRGMSVAGYRSLVAYCIGFSDGWTCAAHGGKFAGPAH